MDLPPDERYSGGLRVKIDLHAMKQPRQTVHAVLGDSHSEQTRKQVQALLGQRKLGLLFIDGDHTYEGVRRDYELYCSLARPSGFIAFHDIVPSCWPECQVDRFWSELAKDNSLQPNAIIGYVRSQFGGIGIITSP